MRTRAGAIIIKDQKVLLIHRWNMGREYFVTPGGGVEPNETVEAAVAREAKEETNLDITLGEKFLEYTLDDDGYGAAQKNFFFLAKSHSGREEFGLSGPEAQMQDETNKYRLEWVALSDVGNINLVPAVVREELKKLR